MQIYWQYVYRVSCSGEGPCSRRYGRTAALRLLVQPCDEDDDDDYYFFCPFPSNGAPAEKSTRENRRTRGKTCSSATLSTTNPTWTDPGSNTGLRDGRPAANRPSHGTAYTRCNISLKSNGWIIHQTSRVSSYKHEPRKMSFPIYSPRFQVFCSTDLDTPQSQKHGLLQQTLLTLRLFNTTYGQNSHCEMTFHNNHPWTENLHAVIQPKRN
jgi:hypothetical protein